MKLLRYALSAMLMSASVWLSAQNSSSLENLYGIFANNCVSMDCTYSIVSGGITSKGDCKVEVQGTAYRMQGSGLDIICDGKSVWVLDVESKEAIVEPVYDDSISYTSNPALLFRDMDKVFTLEGSSSEGTGMLYRLKANEACGVTSAALRLNKNSTLQSAEFSLDDGGVIKIVVSSIEALPLKDLGYFAPERFSSDWIVTDFR